MSAPVQAAYERNGAPVSRERFYQIACDPQRSVAVEACAGAGKTWMLVSRMVRALLDGAQPHEILAITFTKKAAGEMRHRLQEWLHGFSHADDETLRAELLARGLETPATTAQLEALRGMHQQMLLGGRPVQIRTFHSWFAALLRTAPMGVLQAMGLPLQYELLENDDKATALVWRRFQNRVAADAEARQDYNDAVATFGRHSARKALEAALAKRTEFTLADAQGVVERSVQHFATLFPAFADHVAPQDRLHSPPVQDLLWRCARILGASTLVTCSKAGALLEEALSAGDVQGCIDALLTKGAARKLSDKMPGIETVREAQALLIETQAAQAQHEAWLHQQRMARLVRGLLRDYADLKYQRGWVDMGDLETAALTLLSDPVLSGWVQERLDARVRHLLIDEFQDTNPLQWQALGNWLSSYAGAGQAPSVFIVGDPKQSIYRFRRAEPQVFRAAKAFVRDGLKGDVLSCDHTRRNAPPIIALVNTVMHGAQDAGEFDGFRTHTTESGAPGDVLALPRISRPEKAAKEEQSLVWRDTLTQARHTEEDSLKAQECRQAARWLAGRIHSGEIQPQDVMVLARRRERLGLMAVELTALQIASQQPEKVELGEMPEVQDLVALLDVLVSPAHDLSLARVLKSPVFGMTDDDLVTLALRYQARKKQHSNGTWWDALHYECDQAGHWAAISLVLQKWQAWAVALSPHDALCSIYDDGDVLAKYAAACPEGMRAGVLANLRALLHAALQVDGGRYSTAYNFVRTMRAGGIPAPQHADTQAVRLLTIHGAKGLEAPLVLMLDTDAEAPKTETMGVLVDWPGEQASPRRFIFMASETRPPACAVETLAQEQAARKREELNALYVALTRTQHTLVLSSMQPHREHAGSWWQRLSPNATATVVPQVAAAAGQEPPRPMVLKVLPSLSNSLLALVESVRAAPESIASLESRIGQAMHRLLEWCPTVSGASAPQWTDQQRQAVATQFQLDESSLAAACGMALAIRNGDAAWAWDASLLRWHANEVTVQSGGSLLRLDRLVQTQQGDWWILDYKSTATPQDHPELCQQLYNYRRVVQGVPGCTTVRCAFLTPQGALIELP